jgi:hypothetical protein
MTSYVLRLRAALTWLNATDEAQSLIEDAELHRDIRNIREQSAIDLSRNVLFRDTTRADGDMTPEDLAGFGGTSGYDNIMTVLKTARPEELEYWTKWYTYAQKAVATLADRYDIPMDVACAVVAVLSPGCKFLHNLKVANAVFAGSEVNNGAYPRNFAKAKRILETGDTSLVTGPKVTVLVLHHKAHRLLHGISGRRHVLTKLCSLRRPLFSLVLSDSFAKLIVVNKGYFVSCTLEGFTSLFEIGTSIRRIW